MRFTILVLGWAVTAQAQWPDLQCGGFDFTFTTNDMHELESINISTPPPPSSGVARTLSKTELVDEIRTKEIDGQTRSYVTLIPITTTYTKLVQLKGTVMGSKTKPLPVYRTDLNMIITLDPVPDVGTLHYLDFTLEDNSVMSKGVKWVEVGSEETPCQVLNDEIYKIVASVGPSP